MVDLHGTKVTVIGAGLSGKAVAELVVRLNGKARISESSSEDAVRQLLDNWSCKDKVEIESGGHTQPFIEDSDLVVISPGVWIDAAPVLWAHSKNIPVIGEIEFAWRFCSRPVIAVTGSNGKTTVTTLIKTILEKSGKRACLCGNIGVPFSGYVSDMKDIDFVVLEVSSFQLESIVDFRPFIAVLLNISQNHLDRHKDFDEYINTKKRIFMNQTDEDYAVLNYGQPMMKDIAAGLTAQVSYFNDPEKNKRISISDPNFLAVMEVGRILGVSEDICRQVFGEFRGVEHRLELVRRIDDVDFINDSKSTTVEAGRWALERIANPIVMICGGRDKNMDFTPLKSLVQKKVKHMVVIGEAKEKLKNAFCDVADIREADSLEDAVLQAKRQALAGDSVVLSPMCASFDMFSNFEERGKIFKEIVQGL